MSPNEWTAAELVERCSCRPPDEPAWEEFVRRYHVTIRSNVQRTYHRKAREEADRRPQLPDDAVDDLVQQVYIRLVEDRSRALKRFEGEHENSIYEYLRMISINVVRDYFREIKAQKRPKISYSLDEMLETRGDTALSPRPGTSDGPMVDNAYAVFAVQEIEHVLRKAVSGKNRDRDTLIFKLHYYDGLTSEEIISVMGLEITTIGVNSILNRIVRKVRTMLSVPTRS
jgi:RNA polymerase sigma-70 factor (ECF subfamily)